MKNNSIALNGVRLILLSFLLGFINFIVTGGDKYTLTILIALCGIFFCLGMFLLGLGIFVSLSKGKRSSSQRLVSFSLILCGLSFLTIFVRGPILKHDLNDFVNLTAGVSFMIGVLIMFVAILLSFSDSKNIEFSESNKKIDDISIS